MAHFTVTVITTGGTIDKDYGADRGTYNFSFAPEPAAKAILARARIKVESVLELPPKDSMDMDISDRQKIAMMCKEAKTDTVIVTHGTDSMIDTASIVAALDIGKVIVFTGASRPENMKDTDADVNFGFALAAAQCLPEPGVYIAMSGDIFAWDKCQKDEDGVFRRKP